MARTFSTTGNFVCAALLVGFAVAGCSASNADDASGSGTDLRGVCTASTCTSDAGGASDAATASAPVDEGLVDASPTKGGTGDASARDARAPSEGGADSGDASTNAGPRFAAPYVETWKDTNLVTLANATGHTFYTLAFVLSAAGACTAAWNGDTALTGNKYGSYIAGLRSIGGDVVVSFGGQAGVELGQVCTTATALQAAYQSVIDAFHLGYVDFDVEGGREADSASVDLRNKAIAGLQQKNPALHVSYTLPVDRTGLSGAAQGLLKNAQTNGARIDVVNVMAMDYGPCYADMGQAAIDAAAATRGQLAAIGSPARVGITPMIGINDVACETFGAADAQVLVGYAQANAYVAFLGFWAVGADTSHTYLAAFHSFH